MDKRHGLDLAGRAIHLSVLVNFKGDTVEEITAWLKATGTSETRLGLLACANQHAIPRIRAQTAPIKTLTAVLDYIREHPAPKQRKLTRA